MIDEEELPSESIRAIALHVRRLAIAKPKLLPIAEEIERIAEKQRLYENEQLDVARPPE